MFSSNIYAGYVRDHSGNGAVWLSEDGKETEALKYKDEKINSERKMKELTALFWRKTVSASAVEFHRISV